MRWFKKMAQALKDPEKNKKLEEESIEKATKIASELELDMRFISSNMFSLLVSVQKNLGKT